MHEDFVNDHLEEQRRDEGEELEKEGGNQHLTEQAAVLVNGAQKPGDVEAPREIRQGCTACH